jgi:hypothetical protein
MKIASWHQHPLLDRTSLRSPLLGLLSFLTLLLFSLLQLCKGLLNSRLLLLDHFLEVPFIRLAQIVVFDELP